MSRCRQGWATSHWLIETRHNANDLIAGGDLETVAKAP
jgi:hypothetical protein